MVSSKSICIFGLLVVMLSFVASKAVLSERQRKSLGCNAFSGWQTCLGKRRAEIRAINKLNTLVKKTAEERETVLNDAARNEYEVKRAGQDSEEKEGESKQRLLDAIMKFFKKKFKNDEE